MRGNGQEVNKLKVLFFSLFYFVFVEPALLDYHCGYMI